MPVRLVINPTGSPLRTQTGARLAAHSYRVSFTPLDGQPRHLTGRLPVMHPSETVPASWLRPDGVPKQLSFGWLGSTGAGADVHEIDDVRVVGLAATAQFSVTQQILAAELIDWTSTFTHRVQVGLRPGPRPSTEITVRIDLNHDIYPLHGSGAGWTCVRTSFEGSDMVCRHGPPPERPSFGSRPGLALPEITITGKAGSWWQSRREYLDPPYVSVAADEAAATYTLESGFADSSVAATDLQVVTPQPTEGRSLEIAGGNLALATAVRLVTPAGSAFLDPCAAEPSGSSCFTVGRDGHLRIATMPALVGGPSQLRVVTAGAVAAVDISYDARPAGPSVSAHTREGAIVLYWNPPPSFPPVTSYAVTTVKNGRPAGVRTFPADATSTWMRDLDRSSTYAFTVAAVNRIGAGPASEQTGALQPPARLAAPQITDAIEHGAAPRLRWSLPPGAERETSSFIVTPHRDGVALPSIKYYTVVRDRRIVGLPPGDYTFTVRAVLGSGQEGSESAPSHSVRVGTGPAVAWFDQGTGVDWPTWNGEVGVAYALRPDVAAGSGTLRWTADDALPPGLSLDPATGDVSGTPTRAGSYESRVTVVDEQGRTDTDTLRVSMADRLRVVLEPQRDRAVVGSNHQWQLKATGGYPPYQFSIAPASDSPEAPSDYLQIPDGLGLNWSTGEIGGAPASPCPCPVPVIVEDRLWARERVPVDLQIRERLDLDLIASTRSAAPGEQLTLSSTPLPSAGRVRFTRRTVSGPDAGASVDLGTVRVDQGERAVLATRVPAYGETEFSAEAAGNDDYGPATARLSVVGRAEPNDLVISEFRLSGPAGPRDQYVEIYNPGPPVALAGFILAADSGRRTVLPATAPTLGTGRSYLVAAAQYSLGPVASPDLVVASLGTGGLQLHAPDPRLTSVDAVGPPSGFHRGRPLPELAGSPRAQHTWWRRTSKGQPRIGNDNRTDFALLSTTAGTVGGVPAELGSPSPTSLTSGRTTTGALRITRLDPKAGQDAFPNRSHVAGVNGKPGTVTVRRMLTNSSSSTLRSLRIRITGLSGGSADGPVYVRRPTVPVETVSTSGGPVEVHNLGPGTPAGPVGGGLNATLEVPLPAGGLAAGRSVPMAITFAVDEPDALRYSYQLEVD